MPTIEIILTTNHAVRFDGDKIVIGETTISKVEPAFEFNFDELVEKPARNRPRAKPALAVIT